MIARACSWSTSLTSLALALCVGPGCGTQSADSSTGSSSTSSEEAGSEEASESESGDESAAETGGESESGSDSGEANCAGDLEPGDTLRYVDVGNQQRSYRLFVPANYDASAATPLVLNFHGFGSNAGQQAFFSQMNDKAEVEGFLVAYGEGLTNGDGSQSWNAGTCCADDDSRDDIAFTRAMVAAINADACVDADRIYATGMSNGGFMSYLLACEASDLVAAVAPVSAALGFPIAQCQPERTVPAIIFNGDDDGKVGYAGAAASAEAYAGLLGCTGDPEISYENMSVSCEQWASCEGDNEVIFCTAQGMEHCWPGQPFCLDGPSTEDISANDAMWDFFVAHPMQ